ncbi:MAG: ATP-binding cassette domain-containing protein, partial [Candidatus Merdivicinus sp.]
MLKVEQLQKGFGEKKVLKGVDLEVADASIYGLTGVNGAGKSTLLRCIAGVYEPEEGRALLDGRDTYRDAGVRGRLAFVA